MFNIQLTIILHISRNLSYASRFPRIDFIPVHEVPLFFRSQPLYVSYTISYWLRLSFEWSVVRKNARSNEYNLSPTRINNYAALILRSSIEIKVSKPPISLIPWTVLSSSLYHPYLCKALSWISNCIISSITCRMTTKKLFVSSGRSTISYSAGNVLNLTPNTIRMTAPLVGFFGLSVLLRECWLVVCLRRSLFDGNRG